MSATSLAHLSAECLSLIASFLPPRDLRLLRVTHLQIWHKINSGGYLRCLRIQDRNDLGSWIGEVVQLTEFELLSQIDSFVDPIVHFEWLYSLPKSLKSLTLKNSFATGVFVRRLGFEQLQTVERTAHAREAAHLDELFPTLQSLDIDSRGSNWNYPHLVRGALYAFRKMPDFCILDFFRHLPPTLSQFKFSPPHINKDSLLTFKFPDLPLTSLGAHAYRSTAGGELVLPHLASTLQELVLTGAGMPVPWMFSKFPSNITSLTLNVTPDQLNESIADSFPQLLRLNLFVSRNNQPFRFYWLRLLPRKLIHFCLTIESTSINDLASRDDENFSTGFWPPSLTSLEIEYSNDITWPSELPLPTTLSHFAMRGESAYAKVIWPFAFAVPSSLSSLYLTNLTLQQFGYPSNLTRLHLFCKAISTSIPSFSLLPKTLKSFHLEGDHPQLFSPRQNGNHPRDLPSGLEELTGVWKLALNDLMNLPRRIKIVGATVIDFPPHILPPDTIEFTYTNIKRLLSQYLNMALGYQIDFVGPRPLTRVHLRITYFLDSKMPVTKLDLDDVCLHAAICHVVKGNRSSRRCNMELLEKPEGPLTALRHAYFQPTNEYGFRPIHAHTCRNLESYAVLFSRTYFNNKNRNLQWPPPSEARHLVHFDHYQACIDDIEMPPSLTFLRAGSATPKTVKELKLLRVLIIVDAHHGESLDFLCSPNLVLFNVLPSSSSVMRVLPSYRVTPREQLPPTLRVLVGDLILHLDDLPALPNLRRARIRTIRINSDHLDLVLQQPLKHLDSAALRLLLPRICSILGIKTQLFTSSAELDMAHIPGIMQKSLSSLASLQIGQLNNDIQAGNWTETFVVLAKLKLTFSSWTVSPTRWPSRLTSLTMPVNGLADASVTSLPPTLTKVVLSGQPLFSLATLPASTTRLEINCIKTFDWFYKDLSQLRPEIAHLKLYGCDSYDRTYSGWRDRPPPRSDNQPRPRYNQLDEKSELVLRLEKLSTLVYAGLDHTTSWVFQTCRTDITHSSVLVPYVAVFDDHSMAGHATTPATLL